MSTTRKLAEFSVSLNLRDVPREALAVARAAMIDSLGCAIAGVNSDVARIITDRTRAWGGTPSSGVMGGGFKTSAAQAARANATIGQAMDYDPPLPLLPVILALGESEACTGAQLLQAYVVGCELQSKLQSGVTQKHSALGWHSNTVFGTYSAAAAAGRLLGLNVHQMQMAFGIAGSQAGGSLQNVGTMAKPLHAGLAAANGIIAADLARAGLTAAPDMLEGRFGVLRLFATPGEYDEAKIADSFGKPWDLISLGVRYKPYPCCRWAHRSLDALLAILKAHDVQPPQIEAIECETGTQVSQVMNYQSAQTGVEGKFCFPWCIAVAAFDRRAGLGQFTDSRVQDQAVWALARRVTLTHPTGKSEQDTGTMLPCVVRVRLTNGRVFEQSTGAALGDPDNPVLLDEVIEKYRECTLGVLGKEKSERALALTLDLENLDSISELADILTFGPAPAG
ncbi:MAG: MmgE/PrpD family protein [Burkholderiaceae bacterium]|nr:MmgE/PrpD family protein [Burkholderiaceae bacterium]